MGLNLGKLVSKLGKGIGKVAGKKVMGVSIGGGLGGLMGGPVGGVIGSKSTGNLKSDILGGAANAAKILPMAGKLNPTPSLAGDPPGLGSRLSPGMVDDTDPALLEEYARLDAMEAGGDTSRFRSVGDFLKRNAGSIAGAAGDAYLGYKQDQRTDDLFKRDKGEWDRRAPLRNRASELLLDDSRPDLSSMTADPGLRFRRVNVGSRS